MKSTLSKGLYVSLIFSLALLSCKDNKQEPVAEEAAATQSIETPAAEAEIATPGSEATPAAQSTEVALNPPHGQPGHRCEIPVGAPLNSAPAAPSTPAAPSAPMPQAQPQSPPVPAQPSTSFMNPSSGKINPPHGQPGHSCAVAVGAPLPE